MKLSPAPSAPLSSCCKAPVETIYVDHVIDESNGAIAGGHDEERCTECGREISPSKETSAEGDAGAGDLPSDSHQPDSGLIINKPASAPALLSDERIAHITDRWSFSDGELDFAMKSEIRDYDEVHALLADRAERIRREELAMETLAGVHEHLIVEATRFGWCEKAAKEIEDAIFSLSLP